MWLTITPNNYNLAVAFNYTTTDDKKSKRQRKKTPEKQR